MEFFNAVFSRIPDFDKNGTIIVGDSLSSDIKGGKNAGITTVWINRQKSTAPEALIPDFEINSVSELLKIL